MIQRDVLPRRVNQACPSPPGSLFFQAKKNLPSIVFLDEIYAVGRQEAAYSLRRGSNAGQDGRVRQQHQHDHAKEEAQMNVQERRTPRKPLPSTAAADAASLHWWSHCIPRR